MSSSKRISISIQPVNYADVHACAQITANAFAVDPHTIVKNLGQEPYDMYGIIRSMFLGTLHRRRQIWVKAVDEETGEIIGHAGWAFPRADEALVPRKGPVDDESAAKDLRDKTGNASQRKNDGPVEHKTGGEKKKREGGEEDSIDRLKALEDRDMEHWQTNIIPKDKPCMLITGLHVPISHQSRGVGSALLRHGNAIADKLGLTIWVHSSHQAYEAYRKAGFEAVRVLDLDLDEWAPRAPMDHEEVMGVKGSGKWGRYIIRYMKREPAKQAS
ncbi:hypothetical protein ESCO_001441 [Escovopsis weberi]|uniref:N-acetyltransferase domain-containing protein n=1 Tax=Escovopsis weberi TaxID=150374 RepID=A0A0N0RU24_ESCWE|nr:hypothetical protein ESCO_001441 [Escovopsis weberi]